MELRPPTDCSYLLLTGEVPPKVSELHIVPTLADALAIWSAATRVSPIVHLRDGRLSLEVEEDDLGEVVILLGPVHPGRVIDLPHSPDWQVWLSFGVMNVVLSLSQADCDEVVRPFASANAIPIEVWTRNGTNRYFPEPCNSLVSAPLSDIDPLRQLSSASVPAELVSVTAEYIAQCAAAFARARVFFPEIVPKLTERTVRIAKLLSRFAKQDLPAAELYRTLGLMIQVNAGLSRFTSQALSGTTPLLLTECHFWTHSLLGTGTANKALHNLAYFLEELVGSARLPQRLEALLDPRVLKSMGLKADTLSADGLLTEDDESPWWALDLLDVEISSDEAAEPVIPTITFFSSRDGFKSSSVTLSAALASITQCSCSKWSLGTATHELSHNITRGVLSLVYPRLSPFLDSREIDSGDDYTIENAFSLFERNVDDEDVPDNLLGLYRLLFLDVIIDMETAATGSKAPVRHAADLRSLAEHWHHEIEEIITHIADFLYFYDGDTHSYVSSIWLSWSVIPNISSRVHEYLLRTLSAILATYPTLSLQLIETVGGQLKRELENLQKRYRDTPYLAEAIEKLDRRKEEWRQIRKELHARIPLILFASRVVVSPRLRIGLSDTRETAGKPSTRGGFDHEPGNVRGRPISNPLEFVRAYSRDAQPSVHRSLWLLTMLAFNCSIDEQPHS